MSRISELIDGGLVVTTDRLPALRTGAVVQVRVGTVVSQDASNIAITGGSIEGTTVGSLVQAAGAFTTLSASGVGHFGTGSGATANTGADELIVETSAGFGGASLLGPDATEIQVLFGSPSDTTGAGVKYKFDGISSSVPEARFGTLTNTGITTIASGNNVVGITLDASQNAAFEGDITGDNITAADGGIIKAQSSGTGVFARFTDIALANFDWSFPANHTVQLATGSSSDQKLKLINTGSGAFGLEVEGNIELTSGKALHGSSAASSIRLAAGPGATDGGNILLYGDSHSTYPGQVLVNGDAAFSGNIDGQGWIKQDSSFFLSSFDDAQGGQWRASSSTLNPPIAGISWRGITLAGDSNDYHQIAMSVTGGSYGRMFMRGYNNGAGGAWREIITQPVGAFSGTTNAVTFSGSVILNDGEILYGDGGSDSYMQWLNSTSTWGWVGNGSQLFSMSTSKIKAYRNLEPDTDNNRALGSGSARWAVVYSATATINTSDAREKTEVVGLTPDELQASKLLGKEIGTYKWLSAVEAKGDGARKHIGMTVQRAIEIMESCNLSPFEYGFICYDEWEDEFIEHPAIEAVDATEESEAVEAVDAWTEQTVWAGSRYGFRYEELITFIAAGFNARFEALEA